MDNDNRDNNKREHKSENHDSFKDEVPTEEIVKDYDLEETEKIEEAAEADGETEVNREILEGFHAALVEHFEKRQRILYSLMHIFAFFVPFMIMLIAYATVKIFPFGDRQIMVIDSWHQYFPFLRELHEKFLSILSGDASVSTLLYSWNIGAGVNFLSLMAYYASTPLYLFSVLFPSESLREFMMIATLTKVGCSGLFFSVYLRGISKKCDFVTLGFSVLYALSAYAAGYYWCLMWLDGMALLPLVILGLHSLVERNKYRLYVISLALTVVSNYYIAFLVSIFVAVYYFVLYFSKRRTDPGAAKLTRFISFAVKSLKALAFSILGVGLAGFILVPTFMGIQLIANFTPSTLNSLASNHTIIEVLTNLLTSTTPAIRAGLPNIACGLITVIFALMFFANPKINLREKISNGTILIFLTASFTINYLNYYWHAMHLPNEIPYRQAFVFSFVLITIAYKAFDAINEIEIKTAAMLGLGIFGFLIFSEHFHKDGSFDFKVFYANIALLAVYMLCIMLYKGKKVPFKYFSVALLFVMLTEGAISALNGAEATGTSAREGYPPAQEEIQETISNIYKTDSELFYRLELSRYDEGSKWRGWYTTNDPALYGYRGISQFSSMTNANFTALLEKLGVAASPIANRYLYTLSTPVFNMMTSLKYMIMRNDSLNSRVWNEVSNNGSDNENITVYENKYWLPVGFMVSSNIWDWSNEDTNTFTNQNDFMRMAAGLDSDVFKMIYPEESRTNNIEEFRSNYGNYSYKNTDTSKKGTVTHTYVSSKNQHVYIYAKIYGGDKVEMQVNDGRKYSYEAKRGATIDCGYLWEGDKVTLTIDLDAGSGSTYYVFVAGFEEGVFELGYERLREQSLQVTNFTDTNIGGTINAREPGVLFTSIPYEKGWHAKINGERVSISPVKNAFVALDIERPGEYEIEFYYVTDGLTEGIVISLTCLFILMSLYVTERIFQARKKKYMTEGNILDA